ncbi:MULTISPECIES: PP2C family protein-serine/threonine phosphatase [unclassified Streptomyces]|uniref:PP2C family protein-serine/threonine phosphatase n=1 Tax=unclassified Streptomyces TaxID=2593676 RepID=UPI000F44BA47|nr:PP2C family protein-serine/threonine phosphatase [Streptomyces sp. I6]RNL74161.1 serine/threonine-protein phosphatase [Streptomyces sp. I6]
MRHRERDRDGWQNGGRRFLTLLPGLLIVGGVFYDLGTPDTFTAVPLFTAAPLIAAPFSSMRGTAATGVAACAAVTGMHIYSDRLTGIPAITEILTVFTVSVLALFLNRIVRRSGERLASARVVAEAAQRAVLPTPDERIDSLKVAARYEAAERDAFIGGDLYAVQETPYGVRLIVGDVRGKGLDAVGTVALVLGAFREAAEQEPSLAGVAQRLERALAREGARDAGFESFEGFTTAVLAEIPGDGERIRIVNRGHPSPLLIAADGALLVLNPPERALPLGMDLGTWPDLVSETSYPPGGTLLLYTDGLSEARDARGVMYDPRTRLGGRAFSGPEELLDMVVADVRRHTGGAATDDMALLAVTRRGEQ